MILNIRGTNGAGKSHLVRQLIDDLHGQEILNEKGKILGYLLDGNIRVVGKYNVKCGGADTLPKPVDQPGWNSMDVVEQQVREYAALGHVVFEGLIVSSIWNDRWIRLSNEFPSIWLFLDTPMEVCHQRVMDRNGGRPLRYEERGLEKTNLGLVYHRSENNYKKAVAAGVDARMIPYENAYSVVRAILAT